ncbi:hypothetical protein ACFV5G_32225 [Streptomyces sp. NPDC059766]|uniref:hypothetical protein n=1 Tax=Streptomyces sp. NPDC059766 TaxID=3346940 RepID=UPI003658236C
MRPCTPVSLCLAAAAALLPVSTATAAAATVSGATAAAVTVPVADASTATVSAANTSVARASVANVSAVRAASDPVCATSDGNAFPLTTRIRGGPGAYEPGGGYGTWYLDLTNTTTRPCAGIHPVVVLVDGQHALKPDQLLLEFYDGTRPRRVHFETTDEDELVGAFDAEDDGTDDFAGFTVAPRKSLTVKVRLALTSDTAAKDITVNAAVVQRHKDDGDWVGESNAYRFRVAADADSNARPDADADAGTGTHSDTNPNAHPKPKPNPNPDTEAGGHARADTPAASGTARPPAASSSRPSAGPGTGIGSDPDTAPRTPAGSPAPSGAPRPRASGTSSASVPDPTGSADPAASASASADDVPFVEELAGTGLGAPAAVLAATLALLLAGGVLVLVLVRRRR